MATPRNRRSDAFANVHRIVAAAREVFGRDGDATLSQVAEAAGVANATLYRHFPNRRALAAAVYEDIVVTDIKPAILALGRDAPRAAFIDALAHLEEVMFRQRPLLTSIGDLADLTAQLFTRDREQFDDMIMQAQATGALRPDLTSDDVATFVAMVTTASVAMNQPRAMRRRYLSMMFDALNPPAAEPLPKPARRTQQAAR
ncbi:TetR/AcrR family transcriptional regulator [Mycobacterium sp. GA-2829]|uniref:TetR/AcrR family transcriptional regulator n=1 Tax=Mycobacterium sp. GA-2829 TaxID=1772283 RepID=UPI00073FE7C8|nr:TetR/AcrR family transcriptional regulator [Mycobacterium sp. GA-2829]KUI26438.1 TetR family transcriptional regulator [Mycobacterium sp. GA-2829]